MTGLEMFGRFAYPPNSLGYCGPADSNELAALIDGGHESDLRHAAEAFAGAWPYLQLIGGLNGRDPLDAAVVEAYWIGNQLLANTDRLVWGNSVDTRFRPRAGMRWDPIATALTLGGSPNHAFHVFCVYPWVGLLRGDAGERALTVLDRCRIRWGRVIGRTGTNLLVEYRPLAWDGRVLSLGASTTETAEAPLGQSVEGFVDGDDVALHWGRVCQRLSKAQLEHLERNHNRHLDVVNQADGALARRIE